VGTTLFDHATRDEKRELRVLWAVEQVRLQRCGVGKGSELAGLPRVAFMKVLGEHGIHVVAYAVDDWRQELSELDAR
jgi:predicted HTH domain antitoxin